MRLSQTGDFASLLFLVSSGLAHSAGLETSCMGPAHAKRFLVYLHGMDTSIPSLQERSHREMLSRLAEKMGLRIALPRAQMSCPNSPNLLCWGWNFDRAELSRVLPNVLAARSNCFPSNVHFEILGFSNGGHLLTQWYARGLRPESEVRPTGFIVFGAGSGEVPRGFSLRDLPAMTLVIGTKDRWNYHWSVSLFDDLRGAGADVRLFEFSGRHELGEEALARALGR